MLVLPDVLLLGIVKVVVSYVPLHIVLVKFVAVDVFVYVFGDVVEMVIIKVKMSSAHSLSRSSLSSSISF